MIWISASVIGLMPILVFSFLSCNLGKLHEERYEKRYGALYTGLTLKRRSITLYTPLFMLRRIIFAFFACYFEGLIWI